MKVKLRVWSFGREQRRWISAAAGNQGGYLLVLSPGDPMQPRRAGQEAVAFPDNRSIGLSFYHNLFAREHNSFVDEFRKQAAQKPDADSGLRDPTDPKRVIRNKDVTPDELFDAARLVVSAEIAKIHTIEWTPQLLYIEPLYKGMNANWNGLLGTGDPDDSKALATSWCTPSASRRTLRSSRNGIRCSRRDGESSGWAARFRTTRLRIPTTSTAA